MITNEESRDLLANEIKKRIVGPGLTEQVFVCQTDASDEILDNRPQVLYTSGILYPKTLPNVQESDEDILRVVQDDQTVVLYEKPQVAIGDEGKSAHGTREANQVDISENDRQDYKPSHIGLTMCVANTTRTVNVSISYGQYHHISSSDVESNVKVKLGRCSLKQLKDTFDYYDSCQSVRDNLDTFGCSSMDDVFSIDESAMTISPKRIFKKVENDKSVYLQATSFPRLKDNIAISLISELLNKQGEEIGLQDGKYKDFDLDAFADCLAKFDESGLFNDFKTINGFSSRLIDLFATTGNRVRTKRCNLNTDYLKDALYALVVDDPVRDHLLPLLLQYNFFKRENFVLPSFKLDIVKEGNSCVEIEEGKLCLHYKVISDNAANKKYLKLQLQNIIGDKELSDETDEASSRVEPYLFQTVLRVESDNIQPYIEPHRSSIDDEEFELNEELYRTIPVYGKGVNCAIEWEGANDSKDELVNYSPSWIQTSYIPCQRVASFSPKTKWANTNNACRVFDLTIWSQLTDLEIVDRLEDIACDYADWMISERKEAQGKSVLARTLVEQECFLKRLRENIDYLRASANERAFKCFRLANTAMYIQMVISRDPLFKKNRDVSIYGEECSNYNAGAWDYFSNQKSTIVPEYRPFQLAFLLMNVKSTFENDDPYRKENVDLIWFPTGGGKTEAYLALTALTIAERRTSNHENVDGVSVIMRYTLRLLTAQQFERASFLICALEYLRNEFNIRTELGYSLGGSPITLGMWIGSAQTPNTIAKLREGKFGNFLSNLRNGKTTVSNPFPISYCPWCGCRLVAETDSRNNGYRANGTVKCINPYCTFSNDNVLPVSFVDESLYLKPPTLLFATVDKFAQLTSVDRGRMFGSTTNRRRPDLIIQDELHLISGPLGSLVGMFEAMVEELCTERDGSGNIVRQPKIIASTATTRNTLKLIKQLYARDVKVFPVSGVRYSNNFFSYVLPLSQSKRLYMGLAPTGHSASELEIHSIAAALVAKEVLITDYLSGKGVNLKDTDEVYDAITRDGKLVSELDNYWTLVLYYINLKSLGRTYSRLGQEIRDKALSMRKYLPEYPPLDFILSTFNRRATEFTSRKESSQIKELLIKAESAPEIIKDNNIAIRNYEMDIVQATNMISVGIDIARWNLMFMVGQPMTTAEYIQSSSRAGRTHHGLVVNIYNSLRARELSFYENYVPYHKAFYKFVEPLTATTFTEATIAKLAYNLYFSYMGAILGHAKPNDVTNSDVMALKDFLIARNVAISNNPAIKELIVNSIDMVHRKLNSPQFAGKTFKQLLNDDREIDSLVMKSLRDIEQNTFIKYE